MILINSILNPDDLVFDIGCNMGDKIQDYLNHRCKVIGFDPQYECYNHCINRFNNVPDVKLENIALDEKEGTETMFIASYHTISSLSKDFVDTTSKTRFSDYNWNRSREVKVDTLDNMIHKYGNPQFIKIDVEGYELNVLKGLTQPINYISIEFTPELCYKTLDCIEYISKLNDDKSIFNYGYCSHNNFKYDNWVSKEEIINYLTSVKDYKNEFGDVYIKEI